MKYRQRNGFTSRNIAVVHTRYETRTNGEEQMEYRRFKSGETAGLGEPYFSDPLVDAAKESQDVVDEFFSQSNANREVI